MKEHSLVISRLLHNFVGRSFGLVDEIWVEDIELVSLDHFRRWVIDTVDDINGNMPGQFIHILIMGLVVFIPFVPSMNSVEITGFPRSMLVFPVVAGCACDVLFKIEKLLFLIQLFLGFCTVQSF